MPLRLVALALTLVSLHVGCGTGISIDPMSTQGRDPTGRADGGDGEGSDADDDDRTMDARPRDDVSTDSHADDADTAGSDRGEGDAMIDDSRGVDVAMDAFTDAGHETNADVSFDAPADAALDVSDAVPRDGEIDIADIDRDVSDRLDAPDASSDNAKDSRPDNFDACGVAACWPDADYYVDASAAPGGDGSRQRPFKTVTAAIQAHASSPGIARTAYVAAGRYDAALGEQFPLVLRGLSLEGAGQDRTYIVGSGSRDHRQEQGRFSGVYMSTVLIGERDLATRLSSLSLQSSSAVPAENFIGVFCDRGNATDAMPSASGQTHLHQVTVGPGYSMGVLVATTTNPAITGCNMLITSSTITGAWTGVFTAGCASVYGDDAVMLEMGTDDPASGNTISWMNASTDLAAGVSVRDCVVRASFQYNTFCDSNIGAQVSDGIPFEFNTQTHATFQHNTFERLSMYGLVADGSRLTVDISDNRFRNVTRRAIEHPDIPSRAAYLNLLSVGKVRGNEFVGNDTAIEFWFGYDVYGTTPPADFGTETDPGNNVFRCNSAIEDIGGDLYSTVDKSSSPWSGTLHLAGNAWDHVPPTVQRVNPPPNGSDIALLSLPDLALDIAGSTLSTAACPSDRVPGQ